MSPTNSDHIVTKKNNIDQKMFYLEIVGGVVFALLVLLCFLLHYCRKKCMKPRHLFKKLQLFSTLSGTNWDQSTSMSHLSFSVSRCESEFSSDNSRQIESSGHEEVVMVDVHVNKGCSVGEAVMPTPVLQHTYSISQEFSHREESLSHKENDQSHMSLESVATFCVKRRKSLEKTEGYGSLDKDHYRRNFNAMLSRSLFEKQEQARSQVELSSPHSQKQMQPQHHIAAQAISQQHLQEAGTGDWKPEHVGMSNSVFILPSLSDELLTKKDRTEIGGGKPLPHPRAWFVTLDGRSNAQVSHSYSDLQTTGRNRINNSGLDSGDDMKLPVQMYPQKDLDEADQSGSECGMAVFSPEDNIPRCVLEGGRRRRGGQLPSLQEETKRNVESLPKPLPSTECKITGHHEAHCDGNDSVDANHQSEGKKTPWQKLEERPVMAFTLK